MLRRSVSTSTANVQAEPALFELLAAQLDALKQQGTYKSERVIRTPQGPVVGGQGLWLRKEGVAVGPRDTA